MGCPFVDKRYGQNYCEATDDYVMWDNYSGTCTDLCAYKSCENYKKENRKPEKTEYYSQYQSY